MSYLVLARKYRPRVFADVVGQEVVTATLRGAISENRIGHAYLFTGPRGTGKTTTARIFAKALNCQQGPAADPCGVCERCVNADNGSEVDIVEVDAASNNGVEFVRELREQAGYMPMRARFKIYIIDEVHMLSKPAFNALLKTLEEPPPHVKFLFATTELHKVLDTIVSRCQLCRLAPISERTIAARLEFVFAQENVRAQAGVVDELARRARGGMRDALSLADQLLSLVGDEPQLADLLQLSAEAGVEAVERLVDALEQHDAPTLLALLPASEGAESELCAGLLDHLRGALLAGLCGSDAPALQASGELRARLAQRAQRIGVPRLQVWLEELLHARERMRLLPTHARLLLETTLLDLCREESSVSLDELAQRLLALERRLESTPAGARTQAAPRAAPEPREPPAPRPAAPRAAAAPAAPATLQPQQRPERAAPAGAEAAREAAPASREAAAGAGDTWNRFLELLGQSTSSLADVLRTRAKLAECANGRALIRVHGASADEQTLLQAPRAAKSCSAALSKVVGAPTEVTLALDGVQAPARAKVDAFTGQVTDMFGGRIEDDA